MKKIIFLSGTIFIGLGITYFNSDWRLSISYFCTGICFYFTYWFERHNEKIMSENEDLNYLLKTAQGESELHYKEYRFAIEENKKLIAKSARWDKECERQRLKSKRQRELKKIIKQSEF